jgi:hypothetical protein
LDTLTDLTILFDVTSIKLNIASPLKAIMSDAKSFGNIAVKTTPSSLQLAVGREARAQTSVPRDSSFEHIKPKLLKTLNMPTNSNRNITDCQILPIGQMLIIDRNNKCLMLFNNDGVYSSLSTCDTLADDFMTPKTSESGLKSRQSL